MRALFDSTSQDCNGNGIPDECDISSASSSDVNGNGIPDECEPDCNGNLVPDDHDIAIGTSLDCNSNSVPDECDISDGISPDCDLNGVPDECDIAVGAPPDCGDLTVCNDIVDLTFKQDPEFGLIYKKLVNVEAADPFDGGDPGVFFAPTDLWKVTFRDKSFAGRPTPTPSPCDPQPADGLVHIRASNVLAQPVLTAFPPPPAIPTEVRARWTVALEQIEEEDLGDADIAAGFPLEPFVIELIIRSNGGENFLSLNANVRLTDDPSQLSVYRIELRTAAKLSGLPENQVLAVPWYFGVLLPNPLESEILMLADCLADVRLADPVHGTSIATHPGAMSMQWMSYYETDDPEGDLLFWGTRDIGNHLKPYLVYPEPGGLGFGVQYQPEDNLNVTGQEDLDGDGKPDGVTLPFDIVMTALQGDWYDAAQYYRDWAADPQWFWVPDELPGTPASSYSDVVFNADALGAVSLADCEEPPSGVPPGER